MHPNFISQPPHSASLGARVYSTPSGNDATRHHLRSSAVVSGMTVNAHVLSALPNSGSAVIQHAAMPLVPLTFKQGNVTFRCSGDLRFIENDFQVNFPAGLTIRKAKPAQSENGLLPSALDAMTRGTVTAVWKPGLQSWCFTANVYVPDGHRAHQSQHPNYTVVLFADEQLNARTCHICSHRTTLLTTYDRADSTGSSDMTHTMDVAPAIVRVNDGLMEQVSDNRIQHTARAPDNSEYTLENVWIKNALDSDSRKCPVFIGKVRMLANDHSMSSQTPDVIRTQANVPTRNPSDEEHELLRLVLNDMSKRKVVAQSDDTSGDFHVIFAVKIAAGDNEHSQLQATYVVNLFIESPNMENVYACHIRSISTGLTNNYVLDDYTNEDTVNTAMQTAARVEDGVIALLDEEPNVPPQKAIWDACEPGKSSSTEESGTSAGATQVHDFPNHETPTANASERQDGPSGYSYGEGKIVFATHTKNGKKYKGCEAQITINGKKLTRYYSIDMYGDNATKKAETWLAEKRAEKVKNESQGLNN